jgi:hypothetical protein
MLFFLVLVLLTAALAQQQHCYMPDGSIADDIAPCNSTIALSACCDPRDSCTESGFCLGASGWIYRSGCTDQSWSSSVCPSQCRTGTVGLGFPCAPRINDDNTAIRTLMKTQTPEPISYTPLMRPSIPAKLELCPPISAAALISPTSIAVVKAGSYQIPGLHSSPGQTHYSRI